ncbi:MAG TPA: hypothetical protein VMB47_07555 [Candidatus Aquilonibacter sp.]|nr:hypothetical protein [Candidatus Aquilonibacter sp.]
MRKFKIWSITILMSAVISAPLTISGCSGRVTYYDAAYGDYHPWNHQEVVFYTRWEDQTHRQHMAFKNRSKADQEEYWRWRHQQH